MSVFAVKINKQGVRAILRSEGVKAELERRARAIAEKANADAQLEDGFVVESEIGPHRARAVVVTATADAMVAEATQRTLTAALDAGRG